MAIQYSATVKGSAQKPVLCEGCDCAFLYELHVTSTVGGRTHSFQSTEDVKHAAGEAAITSLSHALQEKVVPVPCPRCGIYQENMVRELLARRHEWVLQLGLSGTAIGVLFWLLAFRRSGPIGFVMRPPAYFFVPGVLLLVGRWIDLSRFNPNRDAASRAGKPAVGVREISREDYRTAMAALDRGILG